MKDNAFGVRQIVTGLDENGRSVILSDSPAPHVAYLNESGSCALAELWRTGAAPSPAQAPDLVREPYEIMPPAGGTALRIIRFPPEAEMGRVTEPPIDTSGAVYAGADNPIHPGMHKTRTIDYAIVLSGEIWAIVEKGEVLMHPGDVLIHRATWHSWANRSNAPCVVAFVLIDVEENQVA
ncbi:MAG TPA: cupin domain-containing protein [Caulobacteraceae bacterium]|nr:cupin domain-containing protein [Caulobacteraceae bacterium]